MFTGERVMDEKAWKDPSPWVPMKEPIDQKHLGKLLEELGECVEAASWLMYSPGTRDYKKLENEMADVVCGIELAQEHFGLINLRFDARTDGACLERLLSALGNAVSASARCFIQGIDEHEPVTKRPNRDWLQEAFRDLLGVISAMEIINRLDTERIMKRTEFKKKHLRAWHHMLA
jgi:hypothetical protein